jgi:tRNA pseudouridine13 synthase
MKVKQIPSDFVVEERATIVAGDRGEYAVYLLRKQGVGTLEALRAVRRKWKVPGRDVGFGGLKDRHAVTTQWVTIPRGPKHNLNEQAFRLTYEGKSEIPMTRMALSGNAFRIRLRDLSDDEARRVAERLKDIAAHGLPAYFDDQRFGSVRGGGSFAVLKLLQGDAEGALKAAIATATREDRGPVRNRKRHLANVWGRFEEALPSLAGTPARAAILRLIAAPGDFVGAFGALDREERRLMTSAYASAVWNRAVAARIEAVVPEAERIVLAGEVAPLVFPKQAQALDSFADAVLPLPAPNARADDPAWQSALEAALATDGLTLERLVLDRRLGLPFRATRRPVLFRPDELTVGEPARDDLNLGRHFLDLRFALRPGMYATLLLKRATYDMGKHGLIPRFS